MWPASSSIGIERAPAMCPAAYSALGAHVDHHDVTGGEPFGELVAADLFEPVAVAEVGGGELVEPFVVGGGHVAERRPQLADPGGGEPVVDPGSVAASRDQPGGGEGAEVERRVGDALADLGGELVDMAFALGEHVDQLGAATVAERLGDLGERVVQRILRLPITHPNLLKELLDNLAQPRSHIQGIT